MSSSANLNAGLRLWEIQKSQGTGLCVGLDPHYDPNSALNEKLYLQFVDSDVELFLNRVVSYLDWPGFIGRPQAEFESSSRLTGFLAGVIGYYFQVIDAAWESGIRVFKPQAAFYERLGPFGLVVLELLLHHLRRLADRNQSSFFAVLDVKRGDIDSTQEPYFWAYLANPDQEVIPGMGGRFGFDAMTVTTWMGSDVLTPGLPFFKAGKGAVIVTQTSNPSGTSFQDLLAFTNNGVVLNENQRPFALSTDNLNQLSDLIGGSVPTVREAMLWLTQKFSDQHELDGGSGISPLFSVMGSTVRMSGSFRAIRPGGIALVPGFGAQGGKFGNIMPLLITEGELAGHLGILSSSRDHNFPWLPKAGGQGDPMQLKAEMARAIGVFREKEKAAYVEAGADYPF
ncbi:MAG: orotidine 5'-phosphate decarboxylase [Candidatus Komeilibacteria bacterium]|nr:orotidine 5'-phosphate decarboxylase [Candidatus Komeilibacteria bacterium]